MGGVVGVGGGVFIAATSEAITFERPVLGGVVVGGVVVGFVVVLLPPLELPPGVGFGDGVNTYAPVVVLVDVVDDEVP